MMLRIWLLLVEIALGTTTGHDISTVYDDENPFLYYDADLDCDLYVVPQLLTYAGRENASTSLECMHELTSKHICTYGGSIRGCAFTPDGCTACREEAVVFEQSNQYDWFAYATSMNPATCGLVERLNVLSDFQRFRAAECPLAKLQFSSNDACRSLASGVCSISDTAPKPPW